MKVLRYPEKSDKTPQIKNRRTRVLLLGATGMLGSTLFRALKKSPEFEIYATIRNAAGIQYFSNDYRQSLIPNVNLENENEIFNAFSISNPDVVINCCGIIKQLPGSNEHLESLAINSTLPHLLAKHCYAANARLVHFSTDCVFSGKRGLYRENDFPDAIDLYGRTKLLGEVSYDNALTLRTSMVGHELNRAVSLIDWFLSQSGDVRGYTRAIFSGLPTIEIARVVMEYVLPNQHIRGLYHLSVDPINKFDLLNLVAQIYGKNVQIIPDTKVVIDRSLNSDLFRAATGFKPRPWPDLIRDMYQEYQSTL